MLTVSFDSVLKQLEDHVKTVERKLTNMVRLFAYEFAVTAVNNTPFGDDEKYVMQYNNPARLRYMPAVAGHAKGGWSIETVSMAGDMFPSIASGVEATNVKQRLEGEARQYKLGQTVFLTNFVPYVTQSNWPDQGNGSLEDGYSPQAPLGISKPTITEVMQVYKQRLDFYYKKG